MRRSVVIQLATAICMGMAASAAYAHHSHPYTYDQCTRITIEGRVESVSWKNPHSIIVLRTDDGTAYTVDWNGLVALTRNRVLDPAQAALVFGARIAVMGNPIKTAAQIRENFPDFTSEVNPHTIDPTMIRRMDDSWIWAPADEGLPPRCGK